MSFYIRYIKRCAASTYFLLVFFWYSFQMGRENEPEEITSEEIEILSRLVGDYAQSLKNVVERMREGKVASFKVRQTRKGHVSVKGLGEFTAMVDACLREHMYSIAFPKKYAKSSPSHLAVAETLQNANEGLAEVHKTKKQPKPK